MLKMLHTISRNKKTNKNAKPRKKVRHVYGTCPNTEPRVATPPIIFIKITPHL